MTGDSLKNTFSYLVLGQKDLPVVINNKAFICKLLYVTEGLVCQVRVVLSSCCVLGQLRFIYQLLCVKGHYLSVRVTEKYLVNSVCQGKRVQF